MSLRVITSSVLSSLAMRKCTTTAIASEMYSIGLSNRTFSQGIGISLRTGAPYSLALSNCCFHGSALAELESILMNYDIRELNLSRSQLPPDSINSLLETACQSNLTQLDLSDVALTNDHLVVLEKWLPRGTISQIWITTEFNCDARSFEEVCCRSNISLSLSKMKKQEAEIVRIKKNPLISVFTGCPWETQGDFNRYARILSRTDLVNINPLLIAGFCFSLIPRLSEDGKREIGSVIFTIAQGKGYIVPFDRDLSDLPLLVVRNILKQLFENPYVPKSCREFRQAYQLLKNYDISLNGIIFDSTSALKQWNPKLSLRRFLLSKKLFRDLEPSEPSDGTTTVPSLEAWEDQFASVHASADYRCQLALTRLLKRRGDYSYYKNITVPLEKVLCDIENRGIRVNLSLIIQYSKLMMHNLNKTQTNIERIMGQPFQLNHLAEYEKDEGAIGLLTKVYKHTQIVVQTLKQIANKTDPESYRVHVRHVHPSPSLGVVTTPNVAARFLGDEKMRKIFLEEPERKLFAFRFSCLESRVLAHLSQDPGFTQLCERAQNQQNLLKRMTQRLFRKQIYLPTTHRIHLCVTRGLPNQYLDKIIRENVDDALNRYNKAFPKVKKFLDSFSKITAKSGDVRSEFGLRYSWMDKKDPTSRLRARIRGTARDYIKLFTIKLDENFTKEGLRSKIHSIRDDSVLVDLFPSEESTVLRIAEKVKTSFTRWSVSIRYEVGPWSDEKTEFEYSHRNAFDTFFCENIVSKFVASCDTTFSNPTTINLVSQRSSPDAHSPERRAELRGTLLKYFGYNHLKALQEEVILRILSGQDTIALLPTGYGKSICFQLPALMREGIAIVISPLISLIENQLHELKERQIPAAWISSGSFEKEIDNLKQYKIVYVTPESVASGLIEKLKNEKISLFAIDEAHCIPQWGKTFRKAYRQLGIFNACFPDVPILALTATAPPVIIQDIAAVLSISEDALVVGSFFRPNLSIRIEKRHNKEVQLVEFLNRHQGQSGIIFCRKKSDVEQVHQFLYSRGYPVGKYHGGMDDATRSQTLEKFVSGEGQIIVATVAFGMGVNKPDVRFSCHVQAPGSIEMLYQEMGRTGRDGLPAECLLLFAEGDFMQNEVLAEVSDSVEGKLQGLYQARDLQIFCYHLQCRQLSIARYLGDHSTTETCQNCDVCLGRVQTMDGTAILQQIIRTIISCNESATPDYLVQFLSKSNISFLDPTHLHLPTCGCLSGYSTLQIRVLLQNAVGFGYVSLKIDPISHKEQLVCNEVSLEILQGTKKIQIRNL